MSSAVQPSGDADIVKGVRAASQDPDLGLGKIELAEGLKHLETEAARFVDFLRSTVREVGGYDRPLSNEQLDKVCDSPVSYKRGNYVLYPVYVEILKVVTDDEFAGKNPQDVLVETSTPGQWVIPAKVLIDGDSHFSANLEAWKTFLTPTNNSTSELSGGLALNVIEIPATALADGSIDLRPLALHALATDGSPCDRGNLAAQDAVANAFWQTFWATGALRAERGSTFPVAFLPIDRSNPHEFAPPFRERYISLRRRFFGRTAIMAYIVESISKSRALFLHRLTGRFVVGDQYNPKDHGLTLADIEIALGELNRCAFVDSSIGENRGLFAAWREREQNLGEGASVEGSVFVDTNSIGEDFTRIHRVVPYAGCAFLSEVVHHTDELKASGRIQDFDDEILAATNSTFFLNFPEEYSALHSAMNDPVALLVENGRTLQIRTMRRAAFILAENGAASITTRAGNKLNSEALIYEGESVAANGFTRAMKPMRENKFGPLFFGSVVLGDAIVETFEEMATEIPPNAWLVGDSEAYGGELDPEKAAQVQVPNPDGRGEVAVRHAFAVGPLLVEDGIVVPLGESKEEFQPIVLREAASFAENAPLARTELAAAFLDCEKKGVPPSRFPYDWNRTRAPRTAVGVRVDGGVVLVVVDGRANLRHSIGVTLAELAQVMVNLGCVSALNLDGGGSSVMFVHDPRAHALKLSPDLSNGVVNLPSDRGGVERLLPVPLVVARCHKP